MRRILGFVTVLTAAAVLTGLGGASASAATGEAKGTLYVSNIPYANPGGCHNGAGYRIEVRNDTDVEVRVHLLRECAGPVIDVLDPGETKVVLGQSVAVG